MATTSLTLVENLLNEFYHPSTTNWRKREIETELNTFKNDPRSWEQCLCSLPSFSNQFLWFFSSSTIEFMITRRWQTLQQNDRLRIRGALWQTYANLPIDAPKRQRDTIAQLIALLGKREFPDDHPNFMNHVLELLKKKFPLGVALLRTTSEELVSSRDGLSSDHKKYFQSCMSLCMPEVIDVLGKYVAISVCRLNGTDPNLIPSNLVDMSLQSSLPNDNRISLSTTELLTCVQHLFSWISLDELISDYFIASIFELARWREHQCEVSVAALAAINEIFYLQRAIPQPKAVANGVKELLEQSSLDKSDEMYQDKFTELLRLYTNKCWSKLIDDDHTFPSIVLALYRYTFAGYGALAFTERLEIWTPILKGMNPNTLNRYAEVVNMLVNRIIRKMQFRFDQEQELDTLDNETLDDNMETEWQHYLTQCIETIALVAEIEPMLVFQQVFMDWQRPFDIFMSLEKAIDGKCLDITDPTKCHFLHCILRDLSSLCQTLVRLAPILECFSEKPPDNLVQMTHCLLFSVKFLSSKKFHCLNVDNSTLMTDFVDLYSQVLSAIRSLLAWSPVLKSENELKELIENVGQVLLPTAQQESRLVTLAAAQLLLSITSVIRPKFLVECHSILQLIQAGTSLPHLSKQVLIIVYEMLINCFVLPWNNVGNQDYDKRNLVLQEYVNCVAQDFLSIDSNIPMNSPAATLTGQESKMLTITTSMLPILKEVLDYFKDSSSAVKHMLTDAFKPIITKSLSLFSSYGSASVDLSNVISDFALTVLRTLQIQLGGIYVRDMLSVFIQSTTRKQLTACQLKSMEKILQMLLLVVEQPSTPSSLIPPILTLSLDHVLPLLLVENNLLDHSDVAYALYSLFDGILHHRWQYFYKSHVLRGFSPGASDFVTPSDDAPLHAEQFLAILTSYGRALVNGNEPHITRNVLTSLQSLNERWKLYHRDFFKTNLLTSFQWVIINTLLSSEGAINYELLLSVLFAMGQVNISKLHEAFVSVGYSAESKLVEDICLAMDLPTFSQKMNQLIQDNRCIQLSQPAASHGANNQF